MRPASSFAAGACLMIATASLVSGLAAAAPQDDCGLLRDAPNDERDRARILPGVCIGMLDPYLSDQEDWYSVALPARLALRVILEHAEGSNFDFDIPGTGERERGPSDLEERFRAEWGPREERIVLSNIGEVPLGVRSNGGGGSYKLDLHIRELCDLRIDEVHEEALSLDGTQRVVVVTVSNQGPGACLHAGVWVQAEHRGTGLGAEQSTAWRRDVGGAPLTDWYEPELAPGASKTVEIAWDATGEVGDGTLHVWAWSPLEGNDRDNYATLEFHVLVGPGFGFDLLNRGVASCEPQTWSFFCGRVGVEYNSWRAGWVADWWSQRYPSGHMHIGTHPGLLPIGTEPGVVHSDVDAWDPLFGFDTDVGLWNYRDPYAMACWGGPTGGGCFFLGFPKGPG